MNSAATELNSEPDILLQDDGSSVFLNILSNEANAPVSVAWLMQHLSNSRYVHAKIDPMAITYWVKNYNTNDDCDTKVIVAKLINAQCEIKIDPEAMSAYLYITPAMGGTNITRKDIIAAIIASRITSGIINRSITEAIQNPDASKLLIAKGKLPKHGKDSIFEVLVPGWPEDITAGNTRSQYPQDFKYDSDTHFRANVELQNKTLFLADPGDILLIRQPETAGIDGKDIFGNIVAAYQGQQISFTNSMQGVTTSINDPNILVATIHGHITTDNNAIKVLPVASIDLVDTSTGHINFDGVVHINGNVGPGMRVQASGDIFIEGLVEHGAYIQAGGDIVVKKGAFGKILQETLAASTTDDSQKMAEQNNVHLLCRGNIYALRLQHTLVRTEKSLYVSSLIAQCDVDVGRNVIVGGMFSDTATIDGGSIKAKHRIHANILGSPDAVLTRLQVGDTQAVSAQANLLKSEIVECINKRSALEKNLAQCFLLEASDGAAKKNKAATLHYLNNELLELSNLLMSYRIEREKCHAQIQTLLQASIQGYQKINPNLRIKIANHSQTIRNSHPPGRFVLQKSNINFVAS